MPDKERESGREPNQKIIDNAIDSCVMVNAGGSLGSDPIFVHAAR
jgi:hypothetical protein